MRLAFVTGMASVPWAACEELWAETARRARAAGHDVLASVYAWTPQAAPLQALADSGIRIARRPRSRLLRRSRVLMPLVDAFAPLREFAPDAVCVSQGGTYDLARSIEFDALWQAVPGRRYVLLCHCEQAPPRRAVRQERARRIFCNAAVPAFLSRGLARRTELDLGISLPGARVFQNPLRVQAGQPLPWPAGQALRLAAVARLERIKGLDLLLDVLGTAPWRTRDWSLDICGTGPERAALENQVQALGLGGRVRFLGFVADIAGFWRSRQLLVLPSIAEGVPLAIQEAMLLGRPVIASAVGGIPDWIAPGRTGWLLPERTAEALAATLEFTWEQRTQLEAIGAAAAAETAARLDPDPAGTVLGWLTASASGPHP